MSQRSLKSVAIATVCGAAAISLAHAASAQDVKLGSLSAVTGPIPDLVADMVTIENAAVAEINAAGGILGGRNLSLVIADSQCDAKAAVDAANKLVNVEQVTAIVGAVCSGGTIGAVQAVTIPSGVVSLSPSATSPAITSLDDNDLVYRAAASDAYQGVELANLVRQAGFSKVALTFANDDYNAALAGVFKEAFKAAGGTITGEQMHEPKKPSYRSELATLASGGAEALALFAYYDGSGITIMRQSLENGYFGKFIAADGMVDQTVIDQLGADNLKGNVLFTTAASDEDSAGFKAFVKTIGDAGVDPKAPYVAHAYDATMLLALAIQHSGGTDRSKIAASLRAVATPPGEVVGPGDWAKAVELIAAGTDINYEGAAGAQDFDANGDVAGLYSKNVIGDDGKWQSEVVK